MYNSSYKCNDVAVMASVVLTYSWLKFFDMLLLVLIECSGMCMCTYDIEVFNPESSCLHASH
jgi:hypothetical protein